MGKLTRVEIIAIITGLLCVGSFLLTIGVFKGEHDKMSSWISKNEGVPNQVEINKCWIEDNKQIDKEILALQIDFKYVTESMDRLSTKLDDTNCFLRKLSQHLPEKIISKNED